MKPVWWWLVDHRKLSVSECEAFAKEVREVPGGPTVGDVRTALRGNRPDFILEGYNKGGGE